MGGSGKAGWIAAGVLLVLLIGSAALLYANRDAVFKAGASGDVAGIEIARPGDQPKSDLAQFANRSLARLETPKDTPIAPDYPFKDREGRETNLAAFKGKVVVVNLWAMWCAPCRTEMPTLARLATAYADRPDFVVLPINVDATDDGIADAKSFIDVHEPLPLYSDKTFKLPFLFPGPAGAMPRTAILDRQGRVRAAFTGEADWSSPEARALVDRLLAEPA